MLHQSPCPAPWVGFRLGAPLPFSRAAGKGKLWAVRIPRLPFRRLPRPGLCRAGPVQVRPRTAPRCPPGCTAAPFSWAPRRAWALGSPWSWDSPPRQNALLFFPPLTPPKTAKRCWSSSQFSVPVSGMAVDWLGFGYAALVASGGIMGYAKAGEWRKVGLSPSLLLPPLPKNSVCAGQLFTKASLSGGWPVCKFYLFVPCTDILLRWVVSWAGALGW